MTFIIRKFILQNGEIMLIKVSQTKIETFNSNGKLHSFHDNPSVMVINGIMMGDKLWHKCGVLHRDNDKPAIILDNGDKFWYSNGKHHRGGDEPAKVFVNGKKEWYKNDKLHRDNGKPAVEYNDGRTLWYENGKLHRLDGPACLIDGVGQYYFNGNKLDKQSISYKVIAHIKDIDDDYKTKLLKIITKSHT